VPGVVGLSLSAAADRLKAAGYSNLPYVYSCLGSQNHGFVVTQAPAGGTAAPVSTAIDLRLEGNNCRIVPNVVNLDLNSAANLLKSVGFNNIPYVYGCLGSPAKGAVLTQSPGPGADIIVTDPVQLKLQANNC
jgi:serine/threonine-protein kinase